MFSSDAAIVILQCINVPSHQHQVITSSNPFTTNQQLQRTKRTSSEDSSPNGPAALGATKISFVIGQVARGETRVQDIAIAFEVPAPVQPPPGRSRRSLRRCCRRRPHQHEATKQPYGCRVGELVAMGLRRPRRTEVETKTVAEQALRNRVIYVK